MEKTLHVEIHRKKGWIWIEPRGILVVGKEIPWENPGVTFERLLEGINKRINEIFFWEMF